MSLPKRKTEGQALLITLLVLTIATTVALSLIARSTTDVSISTQLEESARAFSAAEAGIEEALRSGTGGTNVFSAGASYDVSIAAIGGAAGTFAFPRKTPRGVTETIWLVSHDADGNLIETPTYTDGSIGLCWSAEATTPAVVVGLLYKESADGTYKIARAALDPDPARATTNNFTQAGLAGTNCGVANFYRATIDITSLGITPAADTLIAMRVRPEYADTSFIIDPGAAPLPQQGSRIESTGTTSSGVARKVVVYQQYRAPLAIFDSVIYSQSSFGH
jgi:Tfp pilus assembly protein PilX